MPAAGKHKKFQIRDKGLFYCILLSAAAAFLSLIWFIVKEGGFFYVVNDFNAEVIPYYVESAKLLKEGGLAQFFGWDWHVDMGASYVNSMSYYTLGSPFFWIYLLVPAKAFPYAAGWIYMLKYITAAAAAYLYIRIFVKDPVPCTAGALMYAFSGFQSIHLVFYFFHDVVAFFPLLLVGAEKVISAVTCTAMSTGAGDEISGRRTSPLILRPDILQAVLYLSFAAFLNALTNYYFFVQDVIILIIYFVVRVLYLRMPLRRIITGTLLCLAGGVLGVAVSAFLFLPSILYVLAMPRSVTEFYLSNILYSPQYFLYIVRGFLYPGEIMNDQSSFYGFYHTSTSCYLPLCCVSLCAAYLLRRKDWLSGITKLFIVFSFIPLASTMFLGFSQNYQRWWYALILMMALAGAEMIKERPVREIRLGVLINALLLILFYVSVRYMKWSADMDSMIIDRGRFLRNFAFSLVCVLLTGVLLTAGRNKRLDERKDVSWLPGSEISVRTAGITAAVFAACVITTFCTMKEYQPGTTRIYKDLKNEYRSAFVLSQQDPQYRYNTDNNIYTMTVPGNGSYSSTLSNSHYSFDDLFDQYLTYSTVNKNAVIGLPELTAGKYEITQEPTGRPVVQEVSVNDLHYYVEERPACPIGFQMDSFVRRDELKAVPLEARAFMMLGAAVVEDKDVSLLAGYADEKDQESFDWSRSYDQYVLEDIENGVKDFSKDASGFRCTDVSDRDHLVYFSVPNDEGWSAAIDGAPAKIIDSGGMMLLCVPAGSHSIEFSYETPCLKAGIVISLAGLLMNVLLYVLYRRMRRQAA